MTKSPKLLDISQYIESALSAGGIGIWEWDILTDTVIFDERWAGVLGLQSSSHRLSLKDWQKFVNSDDLKVCQKRIQECLNGHSQMYECVLRMKHVCGDWIYVLDKGQVIEFDQSGRPTKMAGIHLDISLRERSRFKLDLFFEKSVFGYVFHDLNGSIFEFNKKFESLSMRDPIELKSVKLNDLLDEPFLDDLSRNELNKFGTFGPLRNSIRLNQHEVLPVELYSFLVKNDDGSFGVWTVIEDIYEKSQLEAQVLRSQKMASIGELAAGIGHEVNNPLTMIQGYIEIILRKLNSNQIDRTELIEKLNKINHSAHRIGKIVSGLKTFSRHDLQDSTVFDFALAVRDAFDMVYEIYHSDGIDLNFHSYADHVPVKGSIGRIQQVIMNLLANAKDSSVGKEIRKIDLKLWVDQQRAVLEVQDNGCGIKDKDRSRIFEPFFTTKDVNKGTGLGLSLAFSIIEEHAGLLSFETKASVGTTFRIELPVANS